jgi:hypothetical protein
MLAKCEHMNPGGSVKDRIAKAIVDAEQRASFGSGDARRDPGPRQPYLVARHHCSGPFVSFRSIPTPPRR